MCVQSLSILSSCTHLPQNDRGKSLPCKFQNVANASQGFLLIHFSSQAPELCPSNKVSSLLDWAAVASPRSTLLLLLENKYILQQLQWAVPELALSLSPAPCPAGAGTCPKGPSAWTPLHTCPEPWVGASRAPGSSSDFLRTDISALEKSTQNTVPVPAGPCGYRSAVSRLSSEEAGTLQQFSDIL